MKFPLSVRNSFNIFVVVQLMMILAVWNLYPVRKVTKTSEDYVQFSKDDPKLLLLESLTDKENGYFLGEHFEKIETVFQQLDNIVKQNKKSILAFFLQPVINNHSFTYIHNPHRACIDTMTEILIVVPSAPGNFKNRQKIRESDYSNYTGNTKNKARLLFFIGSTNSNETQSKIDLESDTFEDIVQESFEDIYHNIRFKAVSMLKWARSFCSHALYIIRSDDDVLVNLTSISETMKATHMKYSNFVLGRVRYRDAPGRSRNEKNYISTQEYPEAFFPPFALGGLLGYPMLTVELLYQAALRERPIWLDDVFITGICAPKVGAQLIHHTAFAFKHRGKLAQ